MFGRFFRPPDAFIYQKEGDPLNRERISWILNMFGNEMNERKNPRIFGYAGISEGVMDEFVRTGSIYDPRSSNDFFVLSVHSARRRANCSRLSLFNPLKEAENDASSASDRENLLVFLRSVLSGQMEPGQIEELTTAVYEQCFRHSSGIVSKRQYEQYRLKLKDLDQLVKEALRQRKKSGLVLALSDRTFQALNFDKLDDRYGELHLNPGQRFPKDFVAAVSPVRKDSKYALNLKKRLG